MLIHATKKLYTKLPLNAHGFLNRPHIGQAPVSVLDNNPLSGWHGNLITLQRRKCVLLVHDSTRFPLFIRSLLKANFASFNRHFEDALINTLLKLGADNHQLETAVSLLTPCQFEPNTTRSVQGTMNHMKSDIEHRLWFDDSKLDDLSSYLIAAWLANRPCNAKGHKDCIWPEKAMLDLLSDSAAGVNTNSTAKPVSAAARTTTTTARTPENVVQLAKYRKN